MYLTDVYRYFNSLRKEEIPVTGFVYCPDKNGNPSPGSLLPIGLLTDPTWKYLPLRGYFKALDAMTEELGGDVSLEHYDCLGDYSVDNLAELYKLSPCMSEEDISLDVAQVLYDTTHKFSKWSDIEPFQRDQYISKLAGTIDSSNNLDKNITPEVGAEVIAAKKTACSDEMMHRLIEKALPGVVNHFTGAPMFTNCKNINIWHFSIAKE